MGSTISVVNDTKQVCFIRIGTHQTGLTVGLALGSLIVPAVGGVAAAAGATTAAAIAAAAGSAGVYSAAAATASAIEQAKCEKVYDFFESHGYLKLKPGQRMETGKMTLGLLQQIDVARVYASNRVDQKVVTATSGNLDNSTRTYYISHEF